MAYKVPAFSVRMVVSDLWRPLLAVALMAEAMWLVTHDAPSDHGWDALVQIVVGGIVGLVVYAAVLLVLRAPELSGVARRLPGGRRYMPVPSTIAPEIAEADQVTQVVEATESSSTARRSDRATRRGPSRRHRVAERPSPA